MGALGPYVLYGYKAFHKHICPTNLSQLFVRQTQRGPFYPKGQCGLCQLEGRYLPKASWPWGAPAPSLGARRMPRPHPGGSDSPELNEAWALAGLASSPGASEKEQCSKCATVTLSTALHVYFICSDFLFWNNVKFTEKFQQLYEKLSNLL